MGFETGDQGDRFTIIRRCDDIETDRTIWREMAVFEGYKRFERVAAILKDQYGSRLKELAPTPRSTLYLHGDSLTASDIVKRMREKLGL